MRLTTLSLSDDLKELPKEIGCFTKLNRLDLHFNEILELPKEIGGLISLTTLNLDYNLLKKSQKR